LLSFGTQLCIYRLIFTRGNQFFAVQRIILKHTASSLNSRVEK
jgi:hypothetical protein